jgi:hypothetical protein
MANREVQIDGRRLLLPSGASVEFDHSPSEVVEVGGVFVVRLDVLAKAVYSENIFGVAPDGRILWRIQPFSHRSEDDPYVGLAVDGARVFANTWSSFRVEIDPQSGRIPGTSS